MEPILDERSLVPCGGLSASERIVRLARTLRALDMTGASRVLRSVRDAPHRDIGDGRGLKGWCFDRGTDRDAGRFVAARLGKQPFVDGEGGLFASAEGGRAVEATVDEELVLGLGLAALNDEPAVRLESAQPTRAAQVAVELLVVDEEGEITQRNHVWLFGAEAEVEAAREALVARLDRSLSDGLAILDRCADLFPSIRFGEKAAAQIEALRGTEPVFRQLLRHLRALQEGVDGWAEGVAYEPVAVSFSPESKATLEHGSYGPMRDFPAPAGFAPGRWSLHTKLTGGNGARLYFRPERGPGGAAVVLVGYFGAHLPTVRFK